MNVLQRPSPDFYSHLFECNEPPTDEERAEIIDKLRELETRREELTNNSSLGKASSRRATAHVHVTKKVAIVHQEISRHRNLLSSIRSIPIEVWQQIFVFVLLGVDTSQNHYDGALQRLCYTSRLWNIAAKSERGLWCRFPTFRFKGKVLGGSTATRRVEFYLSMSGTLPFSFSFSYQHHPSLSWSKISQPAMVLKALVAASSRWKSATLSIPHDILFLLNPIHSHFPFLENLDLTLLQGSRLRPYYSNWRLDIDHFSLAPNLRHVRFNLSAEGEWAARTWIRTVVYLKLPWHQLESMQNNVHHDTSFSEIVRLSKRLVGLDFGAMSANFQALSAKPISLPLLSTLHLKLSIDIVESGFLLHLRKLNLPSLKELRIKERTRNPDDLYDAIARLVQRSGCSLERLAVGEVGPTVFSYTRAGDIARLLSPCHDLTELDFGPNLGDDNVKAISLDRLERLVPALKKLTIRCITPNSESWEAKRIPLDPRTFLDMVRSRVSQMESPEWQSGGGDLLTIDFIEDGLDDGAFWRGQLHLFEESRLPPFDQFDISPKLVDGWAKALRRFCTPPDEIDLAQHWQVHDVMEELECLDFSNQDSRIISRWGVVNFLSTITKTKASGIAVDNKRYRFRGRAKELIRKWRPFLLRDHRSCRYRWYYRSELCSTLKYVSSTVLESDDELWNSIAGIQVGC
ncbi:hypothetical protein D9611_007765 [Ephemerocybe angulata]|uniref:F-box domain-containing protein n=1 Tax=Ephemerocybe angulata TaxID=980116 RepID=A0A8H5FKT2_9AGAR|nr:hypothetical protein D9611_007765 [Tulosesus angulatus]